MHVDQRHRRPNHDSLYCAFADWTGAFQFCVTCFRLTVQKDGPNKGKQFYGCAKPFGQERCNFFQWSDDSGSGPNGQCGVTRISLAAV